MYLPNSGRVLLIDDNAEEVKPLLAALGRLSVPYLYYDGSKKNLSSKPPGGVRYVFLDIELQGMQGQSDKTKASGITRILKELISDSNGPYVIIFWTQHEEIIKAVIENCSKSGIPPVASINMEKSEWLNGAGDNIDELSKALHKKLASIGAFLLYIEWENILNDSCKQFIAGFSSLVPSGDKWSRDTFFIFYNLYKTFVEKNTTDDQTEQFRCACHLMNRSFLDTLENKTSTALKIPEGFKLEQGAISDETKARLNSSLFIGINILKSPSTGNIYTATDESLLGCLKNSIFKPGKIPDQTRLCCVIITPECDLALKKTLSITGPDDENFRLHRVVYGVYFPTSEKLKELNSRINRNDACFDIGPLWHVDQRLKIIIHFSSLTILPENQLSSAPLFRIKRDLLFDLQSKMANHVNRLGNYQLK